jgi:uncharacterized protein
MDSIPASIRQIKVPMKHESNFFRILVNPKDGTPLSSMPIFVMGMDTIPPAKPEIITASIDSLGRVRLLWKKNQETDLWGYRIFTAHNDDEEEFALLKTSPTRDTFFVDSINLKYETERVYYKIIAADYRNNKSPFSETFIVQKPDIIPPGTPSISVIEQKNDSVVIKWIPSISRDVVKHKLYKRKVNEEKGWHLLAEFDSLNYNVRKILSGESQYFTVVDTNVSTNGLYAYTMLAIDEARLESNPIDPKMVQLKEIKKKFLPFKKLEYSIDSIHHKVILKWEANDTQALKSIMVYKGLEKNRMGRYIEVKGDQIELIENMEKSKPVYYCLVPTYAENSDMMFSDVIEVMPIVKH